MLDLVIRGGEVLNGTGAPAFRADVGVREGRVAEIGDLAGRSARRAIAAEGRVVVPGFIDMHSHDDFNRWDLVRISDSPSRPEYAGLTLAEVAEREGRAPVDAFLDLLLADRGKTVGIFFHIGEEDVLTIMRHPGVAVGSDGLFTGRPGRPDPTKPHPRHFGTFPRVLGEYVRERGVLSLPEAVRKMTSLSADVLGLDRGRVRVGDAADLVVFDPATVRDRATFEMPDLGPVGIEAVVVNGVPVVLDGEPTGATPGRVLRRHRP